MSTSTLVSAQTPGRPGYALPATLSAWLERHADAIDVGTHDASELLPALAEGGVFRVGVPTTAGGHSGTDIGDAIETVASVAHHSMAAAFVAWGQRSFIEFLQYTPNTALAQHWLPSLVTGRHAGAAALSNAMKFLNGVESLQIAATSAACGWVLDGQMPWVTNLRPEGFLVAAATSTPEGGMAVLALQHDAPGLTRSEDLALMALQSTNTAAIKLTSVHVGSEDFLHADARQFLPGARPSFVGLQCGLAIGLARRALQEAHAAGNSRAARGILSEPLAQLDQRVEALAAQLIAGVRGGAFVAQPAGLFELRIGLAEAASEAVQLELQASGGAAYLQGKQPGFARRWRESAFLPIVTPSLVQLKTELVKQRALLAAKAAT